LVFSEPVTVKGKPRVDVGLAGLGNYAFGSGTDTLTFLCVSEDPPEVKSVDLNGGAILASEASASIRPASLELPKKQE
jgi:pectinesterase